MNSPKISESLNRFFTVTNADSDFAANDVINMRGGEAAKAGTFHKWNIFRRAGRSDDEIRANNNTRQQFLDALKDSFGLEETGKALVDKLATILGKDVFKPEDYTFGKDGRLNCGKPLTTRRITDVYEAVTRQIRNKALDIEAKITGLSAGDLSGSLEKRLTKRVFNAITQTGRKDVSDLFADHRGIFEKVFSFTDGNEINSKSLKAGVSPALLSIPARVRIASGKILNMMNISNPEERDKLANDIIDWMKRDIDLDRELYEKLESLTDEWYAAKGWDRQEVENRVVDFVLRPNIENAD